MLLEMLTNDFTCVILIGFKLSTLIFAFNTVPAQRQTILFFRLNYSCPKSRLIGLNVLSVARKEEN